jgi:hypothetical protein
MDKKEIRHIRAGMTKIQRDVSRARANLKSARDTITVLREWLTGMHSTNVAMVHRIREGKKKNESYKEAIRRFSPTPIINARTTETVRRINHEMLAMESQMVNERIEHFNLAKTLNRTDLFPDYFYKATALVRREN